MTRPSSQWNKSRVMAVVLALLVGRWLILDLALSPSPCELAYGRGHSSVSAVESRITPRACPTHLDRSPQTLLFSLILGIYSLFVTAP